MKRVIMLGAVLLVLVCVVFDRYFIYRLYDPEGNKETEAEYIYTNSNEEIERMNDAKLIVYEFDSTRFGEDMSVYALYGNRTLVTSKVGCVTGYTYDKSEYVEVVSVESAYSQKVSERRYQYLLHCAKEIRRDEIPIWPMEGLLWFVEYKGVRYCRPYQKNGDVFSDLFEDIKRFSNVEADDIIADR